MKFLWLTCLLLPGWGLAQPAADNALVGQRRGRWELPTPDDGVLARTLAQDQEREHQGLARVKHHLLAGELVRARLLLAELGRGESGRLEPVLLRYRALAEFLGGDWRAAHGTLSLPVLAANPHFGRVCLLKTVLQVALKAPDSAAADWARCKSENGDDAFLRDMLWMDTLVALAVAPREETAGRVFGRRQIHRLPNDELKRLLKLALYLHQEHLVEGELDALDASVVEDDELRAVIAHIHYRRGRLARAWQFMQDLATPNVENMKGNLWLLRKNQELAYAQYKLALKQKTNSHNAAERALPLAWVLKQWKDGAVLAERLDAHQGQRNQQRTMAAAFAVQREDWKGARERLERVGQDMGSGTPPEVEQLSAYVALRTRDLPALERHSARACEGGDLVACWTMAAQMTWDDFTPLLTRDDASAPVEPLWRTLASDTPVEPFRENVAVEQRDIDELDDSLIKLVE